MSATKKKKTSPLFAHLAAIAEKMIADTPQLYVAGVAFQDMPWEETSGGIQKRGHGMLLTVTSEEINLVTPGYRYTVFL